MRAKFLFWNIRQCRGTRIAAALTRLADRDIDVFIFAECADPSPVSNALNAQQQNRYTLVTTLSSRVRFFHRETGPLAGAEWREPFSDPVSNRLTVVQCLPADALDVVIVGAHLDSPWVISEGGREEWARDVAQDIQTVERHVGHDRTVLVGDLNMNPFDGGLVKTSALHAVMSRDLTRVVVRHEARSGFPVFYNPMWSCLGDRPATRLRTRGRRRPPATHYFDQTGDRANPFWQMFDQVLLRPELMDQLTHLEILDTDGTEAFVTPEGKPRKELISDHLPILFELNL